MPNAEVRKDELITITLKVVQVTIILPRRVSILELSNDVSDW